MSIIHVSVQLMRCVLQPNHFDVMMHPTTRGSCTRLDLSSVNVWMCRIFPGKIQDGMSQINAAIGSKVTSDYLVSLL